MNGKVSTTTFIYAVLVGVVFASDFDIFSFDFFFQKERMDFLTKCFDFTLEFTILEFYFLANTSLINMRLKMPKI